MRDRRRTLEDRILGTDAEGYEEHLVTQVWYQKGGTSMYSGNTEPRGYYVAVRLEGRKDGMTRFMLFSGGVKRLIAGSKAFSASGLANATPDPVVVEGMQAKMLAQYEAECATRAAKAAVR